MDAPAYHTHPFAAFPEPRFLDSAEAWVQAKADYLAGESAQRVCDRYDLGLSTFRTRARTEGWRRCDQDEETIIEPARELPPAPPAAEMADQAWRAMADAIRRGKVHEARAWKRLNQELKVSASDEAWRAKQAAEKTAAAAEAEAPAVSAQMAVAPIAPSDTPGTDTPDTALHPLHSKTEGAAFADPDGQAMLARLSATIAEVERQCASGTASPALHAELEALRDCERDLTESRAEEASALRDQAEAEAYAARMMDAAVGRLGGEEG